MNADTRRWSRLPDADPRPVRRDGAWGPARDHGAGAGLTPLGAIAYQAAITFALVFWVLVCLSRPRIAPSTGLLAGSVVAVLVMIEAPLTGTSLNAARSLAPAILMADASSARRGIRRRCDPVVRRDRAKSAGAGAAVLATLGPGEWFGEMRVFLEGPRSATVVALSDGRLRRVTRETFEQVMADQPAHAMALLQQLAARLRDSSRRFERAGR